MNKTKPEKDEEDIDFILKEIERFLLMDSRELFSYLAEHNEDKFAYIPAPDGNGIMYCGEAAINRFVELSKRHLLTLKDAKFDFDVNNFTDNVIKQFVWFYIKNLDARNGKIDTRDIDKMLSASIKRAKREHKVMTHYIPCIVTQSNNPEEFDIGAVKFFPMKQFLAENEENFKAQKERIRDEHIARIQKQIEIGTPAEDLATPDDSARLADNLVSKTQDYFNNFRWIAVVDIPECNVSISRKRAENAVEGAIDILKLFFGKFHGESLRQGHSLAKPYETAQLTKSVDGEFDFSFGYQSQEDVFATDSWTDILKASDGFYLETAVSTLNIHISPSSNLHLKQRLLDALAWYGQAVSEQQTSVKIVKYVAALERLTITKKMDEGLTKAVTQRVAILNCDAKNELSGFLDKAEKVYAYRSDLMHGSISPFDEKLEYVEPIAENITRTSIFRCLDLFYSIEKSVENAKPKDLEARYEEMENHFFALSNSVET